MKTEELLSTYNITLIKYIDTKSIIGIDIYGYKYKINLYNLKKNRRLPHKFKCNPFVLNNIHIYLKEINYFIESSSTAGYIW